MKKITFILMTCLMTIYAQAQTYKFYQTQNYHNQLRLNTKTGEVYQIQDNGLTMLVNSAITPDSDTPYRYFLVETRNIWTFILVDSFTGKIWQTQFSIKGSEYRFSIPINDRSLSNSKVSKFSVQPMTSMYQFYLINEDTGEMWKFQWTNKKNDSYRWIEKIR